MTQLDEIRQRLETDTGQSVWQLRRDVSCLLDLVERAVPIVEGDVSDEALAWLEEVSA